VGGGSMPRTEIGSVTLDLRSHQLSLEELARRLRQAAVPVVGYIGGGNFKLDLRTIFPRQDEMVISALREALGPSPAPQT
jgi:seryl-tRNA(Sec) selenium transferase